MRLARLDNYSFNSPRRWSWFVETDGVFEESLALAECEAVDHALARVSFGDGLAVYARGRPSCRAMRRYRLQDRPREDAPRACIPPSSWDARSGWVDDAAPEAVYVRPAIVPPAPEPVIPAKTVKEFRETVKRVSAAQRAGGRRVQERKPYDPVKYPLHWPTPIPLYDPDIHARIARAQHDAMLAWWRAWTDGR